MESNNHLSELSTYTQSSGYNSSTASSSLNFIDDQEQSSSKVDDNNNRESLVKTEVTDTVPTKLIITITLVKFEDREEDVVDVNEVFKFLECDFWAETFKNWLVKMKNLMVKFDVKLICQLIKC